MIHIYNIWVRVVGYGIIWGSCGIGWKLQMETQQKKSEYLQLDIWG
jgi:hypothetical protein